MPKKIEKDNVKKYAPERGSNKKTAVAKVAIQQMPLAEFETNLDALIAKAKEEFPDLSRARGTVTLY